MALPSADDIRILELAELLEQKRAGKDGMIRTELGISPTRYTQRLMHLVHTPEVESDPRWTAMAHRIQRVMSGAAEARADRRLRSLAG